MLSLQFMDCDFKRFLFWVANNWPKNFPSWVKIFLLKLITDQFKI